MWRLPAEWEPHAATWVCWPSRYEIWPNYEATCKAFASVIRTILKYEPVKLLVLPEHLKKARLLVGCDNIELIPVKMNDSWSRDTLPSFVLDRKGNLGLVNWKFNAWGEKFIPYEDDASLKNQIVKYFGNRATALDPKIVLEEGAICSDGNGVLLTTRGVVLNRNRNPGVSQYFIENVWKEYLGVGQVIWLNSGIVQDKHTDGHIDNTARFFQTNGFIIESFDCFNPNYPIFLENNKVLLRSGEVIILKAPTICSKLPLSYLNFYVLNNAVLIPAFGDKKADEMAKSVIGHCFPKRKVEQISVYDIVVGGGGIHCITMQEPLFVCNSR